MKQHTAVFSSNLVNKYGMMMPVPVLESALRQAWNRPMPSSIGHDIHRATGYSLPRALHIEPGVVRLFGILGRAENEDDMEVVRSIVNESLKRRIDDLDSDRVEELKARLGSALSDKAKLNPQNAVSFFDEGVVERVFPDFFENSDKHGLVSIRDLNPVGPGIFEKDGLLLFAHRYFRRSLSRFNTLNEPFLRRLCGMGGNADLSVRIAIDRDLIGHPETLQQQIELQYWWGPKFRDQLDEISLGVTRHEADESDRFFNGISRTEFWWYEQDGRKTFECEEIRDLDIPTLGESETHFGCRFAHSMIDAEKGCPNHLDGAIRMYDEGLFLERFDMDILEFGRRSIYKKLWRIDGEFDVETWKALISDYFRDNHLVGEYFGGVEDDEPPRPEEVTIPEGRSIHAFAPATMRSGDGVRITVSYKDREVGDEACVIVPTERYDKGNGWIYYVEPCTIELRKLLARSGRVIKIPDDTVVIAFEDMVTVSPLFAHGGDNSVAEANETVNVFREYAQALAQRRHDRMLNGHFSIAYGDCEVCISFAGHVSDVTEWLQSDTVVLPERVEDVGQWADRVSKWLTDRFQSSDSGPPMENLIKPDGMLVVDRKFLEPGEFAITDYSRFPPTVSIRNSESTSAALKCIREDGLVTSFALLLKAVKCEKCGGDYWGCDCVKFVDEDVSMTITDMECFGVFWTDRSAWDVKAVDESGNGEVPTS